jgi:putative chitinase
MNLLLQDLAKCFPATGKHPAAPLDVYQPHLEAAMTEADIGAPYRAAAFLAQLGVESVNLEVWEEMGSPAYLLRYKGYHGRGPIQLTWRSSYDACGKALLLDLVGHPELLLRPEVGFRAAAWFWRSRALNACADRLSSRGREALDTISRRINGSAATQRSLDARWSRYVRCLEVMSTPTIVC